MTSIQNNNNHDHESIKDEQVRNDIRVLSSRLYDLRERFMKIVHKINKDAKECVDQIPEEDDTTDEESDDEVSVDEEEEEEEEDNKSTNTSNAENNDKQTQKFLIKCILENKSRRYEYLKYVVKYPNIMKYLLNDNPNCLPISLRYLEPFIKEYVNKNPNGKIYNKINQQIQDIRRSYLKTCL